VGHVRTTGDDPAGTVARFVQQVSAAGDRVVLACPEPVAGQLAGTFTDGDVAVVDPVGIDGRPANAVAELLRLVDAELPGNGRRLQLVTAVEQPANGWLGWMQTEALLNHVLADRPVDHLCLVGPEHTDTAGPGPVQVSTATHPWLLTDGAIAGNPGYREPAEVVAELQRARVPDPIESTEPALALLDLDDMRSLRQAVTRVLADSALDADAAQDFVLAIDEIVANAAEHGVPPVDVRLWSGHDRLLCTITDHGTCFDDPLAGYGPAHGDMAVGGMGLWLARRSVDDLVAAPTEDSGEGCTVRLGVNP
jgi:anti-sigma regulatory factor (Ser/Thr protein kinase)